MGHLHTQFSGVGDGAAHARLDGAEAYPFRRSSLPSLSVGCRRADSPLAPVQCTILGIFATFSHLYGPLLDPYSSYYVTDTCYAKRRNPPIRQYRFSAMVPLTRAVPTPITARVICAKDAIFASKTTDRTGPKGTNCEPVPSSRFFRVPIFLPFTLLQRPLQSRKFVRPLGAPGLAAVPLGDRQRRSDDADRSGYVSPVGPPLLVAVERRMCRAVST